LNAEHINQDRA